MANRNRTKTSVLLLALLMTLASCSTPGDGAKPAEQGGDNPEPAKRDPVNLVIYYPFNTEFDADGLMKTFGDPIKKKFPHITPQFILGGTKETGLNELIAAGQQIDIIFSSIGSVVPYLVDTKLIYDITPQLEKYKYDLNRLEPTMVDMGKSLNDGKLFGLPVYVPPSALYYNKDLFDKFGVPYPKDGITWDELYDLNKRLVRKEGETQYFGLGNAFAHFALLNQRGLNPIDPGTLEAKITTDGWKRFAENIIRFYQDSAYDEKQLNVTAQNNGFFKDRNTAMYLSITGLQYAQLEGLNFDIASFPSDKDAPGVGAQPYPTFFNITGTSKYKDDAFEVIAYLTSNEIQAALAKAGKMLPAVKDKAIKNAFGQDAPLFQNKNVKALYPEKYGSSSLWTRYNSIATTQFYYAVINAAVGKKDLNTALREAEEEANKQIRTQKGK
ncbi:extracellular solute-binding protein [Paenibacillus hemerocallicola]|uniref:Extracellular solute-binding protein n=1 Tax=Paenibacillus hemerocallicola TaxID=1172614 RepID=A0A5C4SZK2_9BACL|nr:extracellular solute-binding protein [Paenibacillus hemerocallicola]TNJ62231.1 extracellular solute-binding protein [Paenibacillus hemerocallicola]